MQRPVSVTVFAVLNLVFAAFGAFGLIGSFALFTMADAGNNPVLKIMQDNPAYKTWIMLSIPLGLAVCVALLASGIGLLGLKPWGRWLAIAYAIFAILQCIAGTFVNYLFLVRPLLDRAEHAHGPQEAGAAVGGAVGAMFGGCAGVVYPVLLLIFMFLPKVAAAFRQQDVQEDFASSQ
jgi:hypothetical protein